MKLLLLRHGATPGNLKKQYIGSTDQPLAPLGVEQAKERSKSLPPVEKIWVSSMLRARQTADLFYPNQEKKYMDFFREMDFGDCEEKTWEEINDPSIYDGWLKNHPDACFPGGESLQHLLYRVAAGLSEIAEDVMQEQISTGALIAHGGVFMALLFQYGVPEKSFFEWECANCGGFEVEFHPETLELKVLSQIGEGRIW